MVIPYCCNKSRCIMSITRFRRFVKLFVVFSAYRFDSLSNQSIMNAIMLISSLSSHRRLRLGISHLFQAVRVAWSQSSDQWYLLNIMIKINYMFGARGGQRLLLVQIKRTAGIRQERWYGNITMYYQIWSVYAWWVRKWHEIKCSLAEREDLWLAIENMAPERSEFREVWPMDTKNVLGLFSQSISVIYTAWTGPGSQTVPENKEKTSFLPAQF